MYRRKLAHKLNAPSEESGMEVLVVGEVRALEDLERVDNRETAVELATWNVVVEILLSENNRWPGAVCHVPTCTTR